MNQKNTQSLECLRFLGLVRETGLEPAHRETLDPKSSASANSATPARFKAFKFLMVSHPRLERGTP